MVELFQVTPLIVWATRHESSVRAAEEIEAYVRVERRNGELGEMCVELEGVCEWWWLREKGSCNVAETKLMSAQLCKPCEPRHLCADCLFQSLPAYNLNLNFTYLAVCLPACK